MGVNSNPAAVHIHIERLVLDGFAANDSRAIAAAVEKELTRLVTERGVSAVLNSPGVNAGAFPVSLNARPANIGISVARSLYMGVIGGGGKP